MQFAPRLYLPAERQAQPAQTISLEPLPRFELFSSLPLEIREEIWLLSFVPRIIYIHEHKRSSSQILHYGPLGENLSRSGAPHPISVSFSTTTVLKSDKSCPFRTFTFARRQRETAPLQNNARWHHNSMQLSPDTRSLYIYCSENIQATDQAGHEAEFQARIQHFYGATRPIYTLGNIDEKRRCWKIPTALGPKEVPPIPVTLHVCRESRRCALKHYKPVFGGVDLTKPNSSSFSELDKDMEEWNNQKMGEAKVFVNIQLDILAVEQFWNSYWEGGGSNVNDLTSLDLYKSDEVKMVERLMISGSPRTIVRRIQGNTLRGWTGLKELWVYVIFGHHTHWSGRLPAGSHEEQRLRAEDPEGLRSLEDIKMALEKILRGESGSFVDWPEKSLPELIVVDQDTWKNTSLSRF